jgi:hypothetical protein
MARFELSASGIDDGRIGMTSDPWGAPAQGPGLRIPPVLPSDTGDVSKRARYLFCLATRTYSAPTHLIGARQGLTIGCDSNLGTPPVRPCELQVTTPGFCFVDGNVSWHIVKERNDRPQNKRPVTDTQNWCHVWSNGPAMLYETFTNAVVNANGAPLIYSAGLTAYTPPLVQGVWLPLGEDLKSFYDIRFPQDSSEAWSAFGPDGFYIEPGARVSFYASVLQTNPSTRGNLAKAAVAAGAPYGLPPEEAFITLMTPTGAEAPIQFSPVFWRIYGSLIFEDEI